MKFLNTAIKLRIKNYQIRQEFMNHLGFNLDFIEEQGTEGGMNIAIIHNQQKDGC